MTMHQDAFDPTTAATTNRSFNHFTVNDDASRVDAIAKVTGRAKYSMDRTDGKPLIAAFVRCPWGRARLSACDLEAARAVPGVVEVECSPSQENVYTYHGQNAGHIAAENIHALRRGLRALNCRWERLPSTASLAAAAPEMPALNEQEQSQLDRLFNDAALVHEAVYETQVQTHSSLETHGGRVDYLGDRAIVYGSTQSNFGFRDGLSRVLGLPSGSIEMNCEYVGGGFGSKFGPGKEGVLAATISRRHERPCAVFCSRAEEHLDTGNRPGSRQHLKFALDADGRIQGGSVITFGAVGVGGGGGTGSPRYRLGSIVRKHNDVQFNAGAPRAMRAPGHPQGMFALEMMFEELAELRQEDPIEFRKRHDASDARHEMYEVGKQMIGWDRRKPAGTWEGTVKRGFGVGICDWGNGRGASEAEVVVHPDGSVESRSGTQDIGTGMRTVAAVLAADHLGIPLRYVEGKVGTTDLPPGPASGGSVTSRTTAPALIAAALDARQQVLSRIAEVNGFALNELAIQNGTVLRNNQPAMEWVEACAQLPRPVTGRGAFSRNSNEHWGTGHSDGVQFAEVLVDTETGVIRVEQVVAIQSCGRVVSRKAAESQILGAVIQGVAWVLFEDRLLDRNTAAMVNPNLEWYKIAGSMEMPRIVPVLWNDGATGVRSLGEPPSVAIAGAIGTAIYNAIGAPVRSMPITPDKVLAGLRAKERGDA